MRCVAKTCINLSRHNSKTRIIKHCQEMQVTSIRESPRGLKVKTRSLGHASWSSRVFLRELQWPHDIMSYIRYEARVAKARAVTVLAPWDKGLENAYPGRWELDALTMFGLHWDESKESLWSWLSWRNVSTPAKWPGSSFWKERHKFQIYKFAGCRFSQCYNYNWWVHEINKCI